MSDPKHVVKLPSFQELMEGSPTYRESYQIVALLGILDKLELLNRLMQEYLQGEKPCP